MDFNKGDLLKEAIKRLEALEDTIIGCQEYLNSIYAERRVIRYLLFLSCEKEK